MPTFPVPIWQGRMPEISDGWHEKIPRRHTGVDICFRRLPNEPDKAPYGTKHYAMPEGVPAIAVYAGLIEAAEWLKSGGFVRIKHRRGFYSQYIHLAEVMVKVGQQVKEAQVLGIIGDNPSDKTDLRHLHFEVLIGGVKLDPEILNISQWPKSIIPAEKKNRAWGILVAIGTVGLAWQGLRRKYF